MGNEVLKLQQAVALLEGRIGELYAAATRVEAEYWDFVRATEKQQPGRNNKSQLHLYCKLVGNSIAAEWRKVRWVGRLANGTRSPIRENIGKPKGSYGYTLSKLEALARDWEAAKVAETETALTEIRHEASFVVKAIANLRAIQTAKDVREKLSVTATKKVSP